jgi:hypothetical protein
VLFDFIYPSHRDEVPASVRQRLIDRMVDSALEPKIAEQQCHGTLLSATQYLRDIDLEHYRDGRLEPYGTMTPEDVAIWTANFMKP